MVELPSSPEPSRHTQLRRGSSVPGPLEARRRSTRRRMMGLAPSSTSGGMVDTTVFTASQLSWLGGSRQQRADQVVDLWQPPGVPVEPVRPGPDNAFWPTWLFGPADFTRESNSARKEEAGQGQSTNLFQVYRESSFQEQWLQRLESCTNLIEISAAAVDVGVPVQGPVLSGLTFERLKTLDVELNVYLDFLSDRFLCSGKGLELLLLLRLMYSKLQEYPLADKDTKEESRKLYKWLSAEVALGNVSERELRGILRASIPNDAKVGSELVDPNVGFSIWRGVKASKVRQLRHLSRRTVSQLLTAAAHSSGTKGGMAMAGEILQGLGEAEQDVTWRACYFARQYLMSLNVDTPVDIRDGRNQGRAKCLFDFLQKLPPGVMRHSLSLMITQFLHEMRTTQERVIVQRQKWLENCLLFVSEQNLVPDLKEDPVTAPIWSRIEPHLCVTIIRFLDETKATRKSVADQQHGWLQTCLNFVSEERLNPSSTEDPVLTALLKQIEHRLSLARPKLLASYLKPLCSIKACDFILEHCHDVPSLASTPTKASQIPLDLPAKRLSRDQRDALCYLFHSRIDASSQISNTSPYTALIEATHELAPDFLSVLVNRLYTLVKHLPDPSPLILVTLQLKLLNRHVPLFTIRDVINSLAPKHLNTALQIFLADPRLRLDDCSVLAFELARKSETAVDRLDELLRRTSAKRSRSIVSIHPQPRKNWQTEHCLESIAENASRSNTLSRVKAFREVRRIFYALEKGPQTSLRLSQSLVRAGLSRWLVLGDGHVPPGIKRWVLGWLETVVGKEAAMEVYKYVIQREEANRGWGSNVENRRMKTKAWGEEQWEASQKKEKEKARERMEVTVAEAGDKIKPTPRLDSAGLESYLRQL